MRALVMAALVAACSSPAHPTDNGAPTTPGPTLSSSSPAPLVVAAAPPDAMLVDAPVDALVDAGVKLGKRGDVCRWNVPHQNTGGPPYPVKCGPGLDCCYPCGIQGCDFTCMTKTECDVRRP